MRVIEYRCPVSKGSGQTCRRHLVTVTVNDLDEVDFDWGPHGLLTKRDQPPGTLLGLNNVQVFYPDQTRPWSRGESFIDVHCDRHGYITTICGPWTFEAAWELDD